MEQTLAAGFITLGLLMSPAVANDQWDNLCGPKYAGTACTPIAIWAPRNPHCQKFEEEGECSISHGRVELRIGVRDGKIVAEGDMPVERAIEQMVGTYGLKR